jgi:hypothetical protein
VFGRRRVFSPLLLPAGRLEVSKRGMDRSVYTKINKCHWKRLY